MDAGYSIYFKGEALDGFDLNRVKNNFSTLFNLPQERLAAFFSGKPHALKKGLTQEKAKQLIQRLNKAGLKVYIKKEVAIKQENYKPESALSLMPLGADVLTPQERPVAAKTTIDTSHIKINTDINAVSTLETKKTHNLPDISHLEARSNYDKLENKQNESIPTPETSHLFISEN